MTPSIAVSFKQTEPATVAYISRKGSFAQIPEAFGDLYAWIGAKGLQPSGPPSSVYFNSPQEVPETELIWELRAPIAGQPSPVEPDEAGVGLKRLEPAMVAVATHRGPYESMDSGFYQSIVDQVVQSGYEVAGPAEEVYFSPPGTPPEEMVTEVRVPAKKK